MTTCFCLYEPKVDGACYRCVKAEAGLIRPDPFAPPSRSRPVPHFGIPTERQLSWIGFDPDWYADEQRRLAGELGAD